MKMKFKKLFEPTYIGNIEIKNRIIMPAMVTRSAKDGMVTESMVNYYAERAKGGVGLIIVEFTKCETKIEPWMSSHHLSIDTQMHLKGFTTLTEAIHLNGAKAALQISPGLGGWVLNKDICPPEHQPIGPSTFAGPGRESRPLTTAEVESIVRSFGSATLRAKNAGFDAVEIHGHSSYLLGQFMSPFNNARDDKYRDLWRLPVELLESAKEMAGDDYPIIFRISGDEFIEGGRTIEGTIDICKRMEKAGIDCINVSDGTYYTAESNCIFPYMTLPRGTYVPECREIRKAVRVPIILAGRLSNPNDAVKVLDEGITDYVAIGRGLIADPELPRKIAEGKDDEIRHCLSCNYCIGSMMALRVRLQCAINAQVFRENECKIEQAKKSKIVFIIGGGPGGMEAARIAALRGHQVTLYEKEDRLGGYLTAASTPEHKKHIRQLIKWLSSEVEKAGANVVLGKEVDPEFVLEKKPEVVIVAVGASPLVPEIPGMEKSFVVPAIDVILGKIEVGDEVLVAGGGLVGCDVAMVLADKGMKVTIVEMLSDVALDMKVGDVSRGQILNMLDQKGVACLTDTKIEEIMDGSVVTSNKEGINRKIKANDVVMALGFESRKELFESLNGTISELYAVGDCVEVREIGDAIREGFNLALSI
jgi:2,4-dienoyl-CoA reductase-like NADH-dependent reductase (Old Yellow Enzyme family)/thioredoxin reductase